MHGRFSFQLVSSEVGVVRGVDEVIREGVVHVVLGRVVSVVVEFVRKFMKW